MTLIYFIIALSILIVVHEWGHFIVARLFGVRVEKFSIGFGPKLFGFKKGDTEYKVSLLPFGGYVKMSGDEYDNLNKSDEGAFYNKSAGRRACIVGAGPLMNVILCLVLMPIVFMIGKSEPACFIERPQVEYVKPESPAGEAGIVPGDIFVKVGNKNVDTWKELINDVLISANTDMTFTLQRDGKLVEKTLHIVDIPGANGGYLGVEPLLFMGNEAVLDGINSGSPADKAGLKIGDRVTSIDGKKVADWTDMVGLLGKSDGKELTFGVVRGSEALEFRLIPEYDENSKRYLMGVAKNVDGRNIPMREVRYGFFESIKEGTMEVGRLADMTFKVLGKLVTFQLSYKNLGGPIKIAQATAAAAKSGISNFLFFLSFLSMQLGILNLLPIPVLDGGHLVFFGIEAIRRKPLSEKIQGVAQRVGLALILFLFVAVSINDVMNIEAVRTLIDKIF